MARVTALEALQATFREASSAYVVEFKALTAKYHAQYEELWNKRTEIVKGTTEAPGANPEAVAAAPKGIEGFWLSALQNGRRTGATIEEHDEPVLKFLSDVRLSYLDDFAGFKLSFVFETNPYFTNAQLEKTFHIPFMLGGGRLGSDPTIDKIVGCDINWLPGKNVTEKEVKKTQKKKGKKVTTTKIVRAGRGWRLVLSRCYRVLTSRSPAVRFRFHPHPPLPSILPPRACAPAGARRLLFPLLWHAEHER